jgi:hypothetical protein
MKALGGHRQQDIHTPYALAALVSVTKLTSRGVFATAA